jgi:hypothetical protein
MVCRWFADGVLDAANPAPQIAAFIIANVLYLTLWSALVGQALRGEGGS